MSWLRIDDNFADHPKLVTLGDVKARWTFLELLLYCARQQTEGYFPRNISDVNKRLTPVFIAKCIVVGLVDNVESESGSELRIHDWERYNPPKDATSAVRQQRWRNANRNGPVTDEVTASRVGARARPVPSPTPEQEQGSSTVHLTPTETQPEANYAANGLGTGGPQRIDYSDLLPEAP